ncbi:protein downstream neighbor of son homolog [Daphnia pulex]|uniref:protein downstream neighbor of son homolog n=1 Tax=Daphnia pulex TaxID=6669 RepID=UPI001EDD564E|nr:protein downstream neighbor of son homolog [Daphnia pulex]
MSGSVWKKPDEVMRQMRDKKKALQARFSHASTTTATNNLDNDEALAPTSSSSATASVKRKNPFRRSPAKRPKLLTVTQDDQRNASANVDFMSMLNAPNVKADTNKELAVELPQALSIFTAVTPVCQKVDQCPVDWSLKTRVRFTSKSPFAFSSTLKTSEEASGITGFVRCVSSLKSDEWSTLDTSTNAQFHQCCLLWQYPWLPWLSLFPRDTRAPITSTSSVQIGMDSSVSNCLINDWCESFRSLFGLLRARQCPFFYVCTHQFTVLFRAAGIGGVAEIHALLTPTTRGMREVLRREDISYSMPLKKSGQDQTNPVNNDEDDETKEADKVGDLDDEDCDEDDADWINDIGLHSNLRSKLEAERLQDGGQGTSQGTYADSLLLIEGVETQGLFNWLLNSKLCLSSTGPLTGIPPTLFSPVAFHQATLRPLKARQGFLKQDGENLYSIEVQGPILPHSMVSLMKLLQSSDFTAVWTTLSSTKPFASFQSSTAATSAFGKESLSDCGLDRTSLDLFCSSQLPPSASEIRFQDGCFYFN